MKITDDKIQLDAADIAAMSQRLQDAATFRAGPNNLPVENYLSGRFNAILGECITVYEKGLLESHQKTFLAFALADAATQDQIKKSLGVIDEIQPQPKTTP